jgi:hypothetical protein
MEVKRMWWFVCGLLNDKWHCIADRRMQTGDRFVTNYTSTHRILFTLPIYIRHDTLIRGLEAKNSKLERVLHGTGCSFRWLANFLLIQNRKVHQRHNNISLLDSILSPFQLLSSRRISLKNGKAPRHEDVRGVWRYIPHILNLCNRGERSG